MRVEEERAAGPGHTKLRKNKRIAAGFEDLRREAAPGEHGPQKVGVAFDVLAVGGDVGNRQQLDELADDGLLVRAT